MSSVLHRTVQNGTLEEVDTFLQQETDVDVKDSFYNTPLFYALMSNKLDMAKLLISKGANVNATNKNKYTPLEIACEQGNFQCVELLLNSGAEIENRDVKWEATPLICAAFWGHALIVRYLCQKKANVNACAVFGYTALHLATIHGCAIIVKDLLDHGAQVDARADNGATPLLMAIGHRSINSTKLLVAYGAKINVEDNRGEWPLFCATLAGCQDSVKCLLAAGSNMTKKTRAGETVLHVASSDSKKYALLKLYLERDSSNVNAVRKDKNTPLHLAVMKSNVKTIKLLLKFGAHPSWKAKNSIQETPVEIAIRLGRQDILKIIKPKRPRPSSLVDCPFSLCQTINKSMEILKHQFPYVAGLQPICKEGHHFSPKHCKFMQIIQQRDRYTVASTLGMQNGHIEYYDPMREPNELLSSEAKTILADITSNFNETSKLFIHCPNLQHSFSHSDSGLLCLAIAFNILHIGCCPSESELQDIELIRESMAVGMRYKRFRPWYPQERKKKCSKLKPLLPLFSPSAKLKKSKFIIDLHCLCHKPLDDNMKQCNDCGRFVHPNCVERFNPDAVSPIDDEDTQVQIIYCPDCVGGNLLPRSLVPVFQESNKLFDAFVSYSYGDFSFVKRQLIPHLEENRDPKLNFRLLIDHRNFMPGEDIPDAILDGISVSRKFIVVVSKNYMIGQWNMFEWTHMVWHKYCHMILILLDSYETLSECPMTPSLQRYIHDHVYLEWNENFSTSERMKFWETLTRFLDPPLNYTQSLKIEGLAVKPRF